MASAAPPLLERMRTRPLRGPQLAAAVIVVWVAGALYCSGYERLLSGLDNWPGSLAWSAVAVLPWLALFEWSKTSSGRHVLRTSVRLALALGAVAAASLAAEAAVDAVSGNDFALALSLLRRLPAIGVCLLLILWSRAGGEARRSDATAEASLAALAPSIDWVEAADNYVELHIDGGAVMRRMTMREAERALNGRGFVRIHRRYLVNAGRIASVSGGSAERSVRLRDGTTLPVGRAYSINLAQAA